MFSKIFNFSKKNRHEYPCTKYMRSKAQKIGGYPATPIFPYIRRVNPPGTGWRVSYKRRGHLKVRILTMTERLLEEL